MLGWASSDSVGNNDDPLVRNRIYFPWKKN